jgi:hypothetical protein
MENRRRRWTESVTRDKPAATAKKMTGQAALVLVQNRTARAMSPTLSTRDTAKM